MHVVQTITWTAHWSTLQEILNKCSEANVAPSCLGKIEASIRGVETVYTGRGAIFQMELVMASHGGFIIRQPFGCDDRPSFGEYSVGEEEGSLRYVIGFLDVLVGFEIPSVRYITSRALAGPLAAYLGGADATPAALLELCKRWFFIETKVKAAPGIALSTYVEMVRSAFGADTPLSDYLLHHRLS